MPFEAGFEHRRCAPNPPFCIEALRTRRNRDMLRSSPSWCEGRGMRTISAKCFQTSAGFSAAASVHNVFFTLSFTPSHKFALKSLSRSRPISASSCRTQSVLILFDLQRFPSDLTTFARKLFKFVGPAQNARRWLHQRVPHDVALVELHDACLNAAQDLHRAHQSPLRRARPVTSPVTANRALRPMRVETS